MISLQAITPDMQQLLTTSDATLNGALLCGIVALSAVAVFLYSQHMKTQNEFREYMKAVNETMMKVNNSYNQFVANMIELRKEK